MFWIKSKQNTNILYKLYRFFVMPTPTLSMFQCTFLLLFMMSMLIKEMCILCIPRISKTCNFNSLFDSSILRQALVELNELLARPSGRRNLEDRSTRKVFVFNEASFRVECVITCYNCSIYHNHSPIPGL